MAKLFTPSYPAESPSMYIRVLVLWMVFPGKFRFMLLVSGSVTVITGATTPG